MTASILEIFWMSLSTEDTEAVFELLIDKVKVLKLMAGVKLNFEPLHSYDGDGGLKCEKIYFDWETHDKYVADIRKFCWKMNWIKLEEQRYMHIYNNDLDIEKS